MKVGKVILRILLGLVLLLLAGVSVGFCLLYFQTNTTFMDKPGKLNTNIETIEVSYVNWACNCPDFIETKYYKQNLDYDTKEEDCIFIEPAYDSLKVPESFYIEDHFNHVLKLTGNFYAGKGIPESYEKKTDGEKPDRARIFRYYKIEIVEK
jgi:hypothetical protein